MWGEKMITYHWILQIKDYNQLETNNPKKLIKTYFLDLNIFLVGKYELITGKLLTLRIMNILFKKNIRHI